MTIYLDNAATSFPKPPQVAARMTEYLTQVGATINRSVYPAAQKAELVTWRLRQRLCRLLGYGGKPTHAILTGGCTMALNLLLRGLLKPGDHCLVSSMEHNAVMRPLHDLQASFDRIPCDREGRLQVDAIEPLLRPNTRLVLIAHGSNVSGTVQDAAAVGAICKKRGIYFALDAAQTAGHIPVDFDGFGCDALAVPAHKGLLGPSGIGALLLSPKLAEELHPLMTGGTGSASHEEVQPAFLPDKFEPGTPNLPGIYGWEAALAYLEDYTVERVQRHDQRLTAYFLQGLRQIPGVRLIGPETGRVGVVSVDFPGKDNAVISDRLAADCGILTRCGLHCAPSAHQTLGTWPQGTVRFSFGLQTTREELDMTLYAIQKLAQTEQDVI